MKGSLARFLFVNLLFLGIFFLGGDGGRAAPPLPDLTVAIVQPISFSRTIEVGQDISSLVRLRVSNFGQAPVSTYGVAIVLSTNPQVIYSTNPSESLTTGRTIGQTVVSTPLGPGQSKDVGVKPIKIPEDISWGDYYLTAIVDPGKAVAESNENNNQDQKSISVLARVNAWDQNCHTASGPAHLYVGGKGFGYWKSTMVARIGPYTIPTQAGNWDNDSVEAWPSPGLIPVGAQVYEWGLYDGSRPIVKTINAIWQAWLMEAIPPIGSQGTMVTIHCCTCCCTQGTKKLYLWQGDQNKYEVQVTSWSDKLIKCTIPHIPIPPGNYVFVVYDQGQRITITVGGDVAHFTIE